MCKGAAYVCPGSECTDRKSVRYALGRGRNVGFDSVVLDRNHIEIRFLGPVRFHRSQVQIVHFAHCFLLADH